MTICGGVTIGDPGAVTTGVVGTVTAGVVGTVTIGIVIGGIAFDDVVGGVGTVGAAVVELDVGGDVGATVVGGAASSIVVEGIALPASTCSDSTSMSGLSLDALIVGVWARSEGGGEAMCTSVSEVG
jgi:hypothetical protein